MNSTLGILFRHDDDDFTASFSAVGQLVSILPMNKSSREICRILQYNDKSDDNDSWFYGQSDSYAIAILRRGVVPTSFNSMGTISFHSPMILKSTCGIKNAKDPFKFTSIEFIGGIIDIMYLPTMCFNKKDSYNKFELRERNEYTKQYTICVNGESFILEYSIHVENNAAIGQVPDFTDTHSTITFRFNTEKCFSEIEKYYSYALSLCQFCSGCLNVRLGINVYNDNDGSKFIAQYSDSFDDYADNDLDATQVINLNQMDSDVIGLFKILNEDKTRPYLLFLPQRNKDYYTIHYTNVTDMCVSVDREYRLLNNPFKIDLNAVGRISADVIKYLNEKNEEDELINRVSGLLGNLKNPSPKAMITQLYHEFYDSVMTITNNGIEDELRNIKRYSEDEFSKLASKFVDIRNKAAHKGILWNEGIGIYNHLKLLIYLSVMKRANIADKKSIELLEAIFYRQFF